MNKPRQRSVKICRFLRRAIEELKDERGPESLAASVGVTRSRIYAWIDPMGSKTIGVESFWNLWPIVRYALDWHVRRKYVTELLRDCLRDEAYVLPANLIDSVERECCFRDQPSKETI